jgi:long-chain acyl-CoA synthetase
LNLWYGFENAALSWPLNVAIFQGEKPLLTFSALRERALRLAGGLRAAGLAPGSRVGIVLSNRPEYTEVMLACWAAGLCVVPINAKLHEREFAYVLDNSGAAACMTDAAHVEAVGRAAMATRCRVIDVETTDYAQLFDVGPTAVTQVEAKDPAWIFYTSGTTGRPKGAVLSHRNMWFQTLSYMTDAGPIDSTTRSLMVAPQSHASGLLLLAYLARGAAGVLPDSGGFDPDEVISLINHHGNSCFFGAPTMVKRLVEFRDIGMLDRSRLNTVVYGGGPMYVADTLKALDVLGPCLWQIYGQGETPCTITYLSKEKHSDSEHPRYLERLASVGLPRTGIAMKVVDDEMREVPPNTVGEIIVRADTVMEGYLENPAATAEALRDGWLHTGDLGSRDVDGYLTLKDRAKDMIISGGTNIYPREIEEVLLTHPGVLECSVIGVRDADWGEIPVGVVVSRPGMLVTPDELDALCLTNIARFKRPKRYHFIDNLPKNNYGKILKTELRLLNLPEH